MKPSFSPDRPDEVFQLIWEYHTQDGSKYHEEKEAKLREVQRKKMEMEDPRKDRDRNRRESEVIQHELMIKERENQKDKIEPAEENILMVLKSPSQ
jgi:hypothetical protein